MTVSGDNANVMRFVDGVQTGDRLFLVTSLKLDQDKERSATTANSGSMPLIRRVRLRAARQAGTPRPRRPNDTGQRTEGIAGRSSAPLAGHC